LRAFPELHAEWNAGTPRSFDAVKLAVSVMAEHGVVTPTIEFPSTIDADFESRLSTIISEAARGHIALQYLSASTSGFAELGAWPVTAASGILIRPQSTSIAIGRAHITDDGEYQLPFTITADHRLSDPADVALLAQHFARELHT
jgi:pyruvate/2-oxoglutarate dehydrogenase complex dihydrolipoamide acyltransferase (E2) component